MSRKAQAFVRFGMPLNRRLVSTLVVAIAICLLPFPGFAQTSQGTIQGSVFDQTGGAIAGAMVTVTDVARGATRTLTTDSAGAYVAPNLNPGTYSVKASSSGFQTLQHDNVLVEVATNNRIDFNLQPGAQTQTITVTSEAPAVDTTDATLGGTVNNQEINALPLNGRNFERLLELRPGVVPTIGAGTGLTSSNGLRPGENITMVEGLVTIAPLQGGDIMNSQYHQGDATSLLPLDAIQEFNVQEYPKAEYGWKDGAVQNVGVKSGTNTIHGTAYAFGRDDDWDASNYFTGARVPMALKQYGVTAGGPILKDRLFWFLGFEGLNYQVGNSSSVSIPSDFPTQLPASQDPGNTLTVFDACTAIGRNKVNPLSALLAGLPAGSCVPQPSSSTFENVFPFNETAPNGKAITFTPPLTTNNPIYNGVAKLDYNLNNANHLAGMYFIGYQNATVQTSASQMEPQWLVLSYSKVQDANGSWVYTPNSTWVNEMRGGRVLQTLTSTPVDGNLLASAPWPNGYGVPTGVTLNTPAGTGAGGMPQVTISGFSGILGEGNQRGVRGPLGTDDILDHVSYLHGKHAFKFGFEFLNEHGNNNSYSVGAGDLTFTGLQNFLTGTLNTGQIFTGNALEATRARSYGAFVQDDWRVTPRLTLNLGVRYEITLPLSDENDYMGNFNPNANPSTQSAIQVVGGPGQPPFYHEQRDNFAPRAGFAWDVRGNGKTVVRGGVFVMYNQLAPGLLEGSPTNPFAANVPSIGVNNSGTALNQNTPYRVTLAGNFLNWSLAGPIYPVFPQTLTTTGAHAGTYTGPSCTYMGETGLPANFTPVPCNFPNATPGYLATPRAYEWDFDIQRAITNSLSLEVAYVGNHGREMSETDINQPPMGWGWNNSTSALNGIFNSTTLSLPGGVSPTAFCLASAAANYNQCSANKTVKTTLSANEEAGQVYFSQFPYLSYVNSDGLLDWSNYNSFQVTGTQRLNHGLTFLAGYTLSKALGSLSGDSIAGSNPVDVRNLKANYGFLPTDQRQRVTLSATYALPQLFKAPAQMLQGWTASFIVAAFTGFATTVSDTTDDLQGTGEETNTAAAPEFWNYQGPASAFAAGPHNVPCFGVMSGCTPYSSLPGGTPPAVCVSAAQAPYAPGSQQQQLALAALYNIGCYVQNGGVLTPPAYGTIGNAGPGFFRGPGFVNIDMTVQKEWKFRERYTAQFRAEFFNLLNRADFSGGGGNPASGGQFDCSCNTPDAAGTNSVLGSGGARAIQFGLKLGF